MGKRGGALFVFLGILASRLMGLLRERVIAHYLGNSAALDAFRAALRIPNVLQNLLGDGVLSASFIPVYARALRDEDAASASTLARTVGSLLAVFASLLAVVGVSFAEPFTRLIVPGFAPETFALTVHMVRILFPGVALLVLSAWCLGVLGSHRAFFLAYASPVLWNAAIIAACGVAAYGGLGEGAVAVYLAWGALVGAALQLAVQLPAVYRRVGSLRPAWGHRHPGVRATLRAFGPVVLGRGSVQVSAYLDQILASYLTVGVVAGLGYAQIIYLLPISLFGMSIAAAELPEMSTAHADTPAGFAPLRARLAAASRRLLFLIVPSMIALLALGDAIVGLLFQTGRFDAAAREAVWIMLAGMALGLVAATLSRLLISALYALRYTRLPLYAALARVGLAFGLGWLIVFPVRAWLRLDGTWAAFGLGAVSAVAGWVELALVYRWLRQRIGAVALPLRFALGMLGASLVAASLARGSAVVGVALRWPSAVTSLVMISSYGVALAGLLLAAKVPEARAVWARLRRR